MRILLIEDDSILGAAVRDQIAADGHSIDWVVRLDAARAHLRSAAYDLMLLDLMLPDGHGVAFLRELRGSGNATPVIILTALDRLSDRIEGLNAGADDYLVKPVDLGELAARLRGLIRRSAGRAEPLLTVGPLVIDPAAHTTRFRGRAIELSAREFALLHELACAAGRVLSKEQLAERVYGWGEEVESNAVEVHVHHLRRKLAPEVIVTVRGVGYLVPKDLR